MAVGAYNTSGNTTNLIKDKKAICLARTNADISSEVFNWIRLRNNKPPSQTKYMAQKSY